MLFRLDESDSVSNYTQPYRVALINYLNFIQNMNTSDRSQIDMPYVLMT